MIDDCKTIGIANIDCIVQNQIFSIVFKFTSEGVPMDLSLYPKIFFDCFFGSTISFRKTIGAGITVDGNELLITISENDSKKIPQNLANYELRLVNETDQNLHALKGSLKFIKTVSR